MDWLGSLAVVLIGAVLAHRLTIGRDKLTARRTAGAKFRGGILAALNGLYTLPVNWPDDIDHTLRRAFPTLQTAIAEFRPFVPWWRRRAYDRAWFRYRCATGRQVDIQCYHHYVDFLSPDEPPTDA
jgi:hypothetical protein